MSAFTSDFRCFYSWSTEEMQVFMTLQPSLSSLLVFESKHQVSKNYMFRSPTLYMVLIKAFICSVCMFFCHDAGVFPPEDQLIK